LGFAFVSDLMVLRGRVSGLGFVLDVFFEPGFRLFLITLFFLSFKFLPRWERTLFADRFTDASVPVICKVFSHLLLKNKF